MMSDFHEKKNNGRKKGQKIPIEGTASWKRPIQLPTQQAPFVFRHILYVYMCTSYLALTFCKFTLHACHTHHGMSSSVRTFDKSTEIGRAAMKRVLGRSVLS